jgi:phospholipid transport system substrate-binding protein
MYRIINFCLRAGAAALAFAAVAESPAWAEPEAPAQQAGEAKAPQTVIDGLDHTLLGVMKDATKLGYHGRYTALEPIIQRTFNVPLMTELVVGQAWGTWTKEQHDQVSDAFRRFITATYARRFDGYSGGGFVIAGARQAVNGTIVMTRLTRPDDKPVTINYLMRDNGEGSPRVVDVYLTGTISELATRHSEFSAVLEHDGFAGLLAALDKKANSQAMP